MERANEVLEDSPAARVAPRGRLRGCGRGRVHRGACKRGSLSQPPLEHLGTMAIRISGIS